MVNIEIGRARMYFSIENRIKMGASRLGYGKYNFWGKNGVVLTFPFYGQNDVVLSMRIFFKKFKTLIKTTLFWFVRDQNDVVLEVVVYKGKLSFSILDDSEKIKK